MKSFGAFFLIVMLICLVSLYMKAKLEKSNKSETIMYKEVPTAFWTPNTIKNQINCIKKWCLEIICIQYPLLTWNKDKYLIFKYSLHLYEIIIISVFGTIYSFYSSRIL